MISLILRLESARIATDPNSYLIGTINETSTKCTKCHVLFAIALNMNCWRFFLRMSNY